MITKSLFLVLIISIQVLASNLILLFDSWDIGALQPTKIYRSVRKIITKLTKKLFFSIILINLAS